MDKPLLSKEEFVKIMNQIKDEEEKESALNDALTNLSPDFYCSFYPLSASHTTIINLLCKIFNLKYNELYGNDIDYFMYDLEWGKEAEDFKFEAKGKEWVLKTLEDLYDYLIYKEDN